MPKKLAKWNQTRRQCSYVSWNARGVLFPGWDCQPEVLLGGFLKRALPIGFSIMTKSSPHRPFCNLHCSDYPFTHLTGSNPLRFLCVSHTQNRHEKKAFCHCGGGKTKIAERPKEYPEKWMWKMFWTMEESVGEWTCAQWEILWRLSKIGVKILRNKKVTTKFPFLLDPHTIFTPTLYL